MSVVVSETPGDVSGTAAVAAEGQFRGTDPRKKSAFLAGLFSLIPGLGQIYVGYYQRGFVHVIVAGSVLSLLIANSAGDDLAAFFPLGVIFLIFFELYNIIDAARRALYLNLSLDGIEEIELPDEFTRVSLGGSYLGGVTLLVVGILSLAHTAFGMSMEWIESWWPLVPIALGGYLFFQARVDQERKTATEANSQTTSQSEGPALEL